MFARRIVSGLGLLAAGLCFAGTAAAADSNEALVKYYRKMANPHA